MTMPELIAALEVAALEAIRAFLTTDPSNYEFDNLSTRAKVAIDALGCLADAVDR